MNDFAIITAYVVADEVRQDCYCVAAFFSQRLEKRNQRPLVFC